MQGFLIITMELFEQTLLIDMYILFIFEIWNANAFDNFRPWLGVFQNLFFVHCKSLILNRLILLQRIYNKFRLIVQLSCRHHLNLVRCHKAPFQFLQMELNHERYFIKDLNYPYACDSSHENTISMLPILPWASISFVIVDFFVSTIHHT
jgi:hypothetical protein